MGVLQDHVTWLVNVLFEDLDDDQRLDMVEMIEAAVDYYRYEKENNN